MMPRLSLRSFTGKLTLLVGVAVLIPLLSASLILGRQLNRQARSLFAIQLTASLETFSLILHSMEENLDKSLPRTAADSTLQVTLDLEIVPQLQSYINKQRVVLGLSFLAVADAQDRLIGYAGLDDLGAVPPWGLLMSLIVAVEPSISPEVKRVNWKSKG